MLVCASITESSHAVALDGVKHGGVTETQYAGLNEAFIPWYVTWRKGFVDVNKHTQSRAHVLYKNCFHV